MFSPLRKKYPGEQNPTYNSNVGGPNSAKKKRNTSKKHLLSATKKQNQINEILALSPNIGRIRPD
jgi:hypothetical protein